MLPTPEEVRALAARLLRPELLLFPVRHHSPACAWQLQRWLAQVQPSEVLVEGPHSFDRLIPQLAHPDARWPLAIYAYTVFKAGAGRPAQRHAAYYPFCAHSPEAVALRAAVAAGIPVRFIDLDHAEQCALETAGGGVPPGPEADGPVAQSLLDEQHLQRSAHLAALAAQLGCRDHEELWEHLFELRAPQLSLQQHLLEITAYCHLARLGSSGSELQADGTLAREQAMAGHIRQALARRTAGQGPVLVVVGGFHAVALPALLETPAGQPPAPPSLTVAETGSALIRYSQDRLDRLNGYAAGMTSPAWQQQVWDRLQQHGRAGLAPGPRVRREAALAVLFEVASELRMRHGVPLPVPALAAAYQQALQLAALRGRPAPARDDVLDAVTSCFVKGDADADGAQVLAVARRVLCGHAVGQVPPGADTPPLLRDFQQRARVQRLKIDDGQPRRAVLEIYRRPEHRVTSRLFHGLALLGVPWAQRSAGPDFVNGLGLDRLQEHWSYCTTAATEAALVEASVWGSTVPQAVAACFADQLARLEASAQPRHAQVAAARLAQACVLGLQAQLQPVCDTLAAWIAADPSFASVAQAAGTLGLLMESREPLQARALPQLPALLQAAYTRALYLGRTGPAPADEGRETVAALVRLRELLASEAGRTLDAGLYWALVAALAAGTGAGPAQACVRGAAAGLAHGAGHLTPAGLAEALRGHLHGGIPAADAIAFLRGLLQTAREAAWQHSALLEGLDALLAGWDDEAFVSHLPGLRLAFAEMTPRETDRIARAVADLHGPAADGAMAAALAAPTPLGLSAAQVQAHLEVHQRLLALLRDDGLAAWLDA